MKKFIFITIWLIGCILNSTCETYVFHFGYWYSGLFGMVWSFLVLKAYRYEEKKINVKINWINPADLNFTSMDHHQSVNTSEKKSFIKK